MKKKNEEGKTDYLGTKNEKIRSTILGDYVPLIHIQKPSIIISKGGILNHYGKVVFIINGYTIGPPFEKDTMRSIPFIIHKNKLTID